ncbi:MmgE/PrpD [Penicillium waksmanii]|uniref:MmgE/PrpD n=1 Tax=Penicillium waksmanii TaxID=69791 RepID=UPI002548CC32|nr:MmgE/PrpD [Penicillium waksmanii]KAJ5987748.1 MmgE/PrpD [Penicillium waksmanii]
MATKHLATWALALQYTNLTQPVTDMAVKSIYNWAGCAIGGYALPPAGVAYDAVTPMLPENAGNSSILGSDAFVDIQTAALVNGIASHVDDYDDTHADTPVHPSGPVLSALLAVAEWKAPVSGEDLLTAFVAGVEAECKLGISVYPEHYDIGWHITSTTGSVGAAVAVGKLIGLDLEKLQHAISIAAVQVIGMHESFGTDTKPFHVGRAAQSGLLAAVLAQNGFGSSLEGLEAERGWANVVSTRNNVTKEFTTLGNVWEITKNTFKPFPCDRIIHAAIDGWIQIHDQAVEKKLDLTSIVNVTARTNPKVLFLTDNPEPKTGLDGKFSVYHAAAVSLLFGEATPVQFTDEAVKNSTVVSLRKKVCVTSDDAVSEHEAFVTAEFKDGTKLEVHVKEALGSIKKPLSAKQLKEKFLEHVSNHIGKERAQKAFTGFSEIASSTDVAQILRQFKK